MTEKLKPQKNDSRIVELTKEHYEELLAVESGADIFGMYNAKLLREIEATEPSFIKICDYQGEYDGAGQLPYFGAIAAEVGVIFANRRLKAINKATKEG